MSSIKSKQEVDTSKLDNEVAEFHVEQAMKASEVKVQAGQLSSGYESLSLWQTVKVFKVATAYCFAAAFSAATDGYQIGINGSIIANKGFVHQFATATNADGDEYLTAPILAGWSSIMSVGQIIGMLTIPFLSDRYGRKIAMWTYWTILPGLGLFGSLLSSSRASELVVFNRHSQSISQSVHLPGSAEDFLCATVSGGPSDPSSPTSPCSF
ncbi:hypothetical protein LB503_010531 [Fusarium chuoi]|nr:hypothetical protein LB503_010531 [Fusarium chuoi]